jgi:hypothetical protein
MYRCLTVGGKMWVTKVDDGRALNPKCNLFHFCFRDGKRSRALLLFQILDFQLVKCWPVCSCPPLFFQPFAGAASCQDGGLPQSSYHYSGIRCVRSTFPFGPGACSPNLPVCLRLSNSVACEALACLRWHIYVSLPTLLCLPLVTVVLRL